MKKIMLPAFVLSIAITGLFYCKKDKDTAPAKSKTELLTQKAWVQTNDEISTGGGAFTSDWASYLPCEKDDITTFKTDKTYQITDGALVCVPPDADNGTWAFSADEKSIILEGVFPATINTLNENSLVVTSTDGTDSYRATFSH